MSKMKDLDIDRMNADLPKKTTKGRFQKMLEILPPARMMKDWFLVGEPADHLGEWNAPRYDMFTCYKGKYLERGAKTVEEFWEIMSTIHR